MNKFVDNYDLFIFDLDDTLIKTEQYHYEAWIKTLKYYISPDFFIDDKSYSSIFHSIDPNSMFNYITKYHKLTNFEEVYKKKQMIYVELLILNKDKLKLIDGCFQLIQEILDKNKQFIIVSNTLKANIDFFTELFPILKYSSKNYYREIIKNKKPDPECYIQVVKDFPEKRLVGFEDSITGIHSISQVPKITSFFINSTNYYYYDYIISNYNVNYIENYYNLNKFI